MTGVGVVASDMAPFWLSKLVTVTIDEQQKPLASASIVVFIICLQQTRSTPCAPDALSALRASGAQGVLRILDSIELAIERSYVCSKQTCETGLPRSKREEIT